MKGSMVFYFFYFRSVDNENQQIEMAKLVQKGNNSVNEVSKKNPNVAQYVAIQFLNKYNIVKNELNSDERCVSGKSMHHPVRWCRIQIEKESISDGDE